MTEQYSQEQLNEAYFIQLVYTFQAAAMQQMGKIINPLTGELEKNMEQAKHSIDMLAMLEAKTRGNLTDREQKMLEKILFELRMNYVDEMKVTEEEEEGSEGEEEGEKKKQVETASPKQKERKLSKKTKRSTSAKEGKSDEGNSNAEPPANELKTES
jgi:hypothetical protein